MAVLIDEDVLRRLGYTVERIRDGRGCLVWNDDEHWIGEGDDPAAALASAVAKIFPSRLAREAVAAYVAASAAPASAEPTSQALRIVRPADPERAAPAAPRATQRELDELDRLVRLVASGADALGRMTSECQRMRLFGWVARARSYEERFPDDEHVVRGVRAVAVRCGAYAKSYWPGTVRGLRRYAIPQDSLRGLSGAPELRHVSPQTWAAAADLVQRVLDRLAENPQFDGGWNDATECDAATADAEVARAETIIDLAMPADGPRATNAAPQLLEAARRLRRARRTATDGAHWGALMGRLRVAAAGDPELRATLAPELDPA